MKITQEFRVEESNGKGDKREGTASEAACEGNRPAGREGGSSQVMAGRPVLQPQRLLHKIMITGAC